ncbi:TonB-dependent receptor domain-containing protein [Sphingomonas glacialis]|uniref:TonB-dependent receptor n=1 Tax=Sphingomonas glacialis TaxID=658225 RepID=A0A502FRC0_9SPHN|nr:TonB-dependent receptor [Sphingomonas glacialis]TPG52107.1 TonB-dependent receptor [Sphingomonas glacialis]
MTISDTTPPSAQHALKRLLLTGASAFTVFAAMPAFAQSQPIESLPPSQPAASIPASEPSPADATSQDIVVTGSRIASPTLKSPSPLQVITAEDIQRQGTTNVQDILQNNPAIGAPGRSRNTGGNDTDPGLATLNLRNLGPDRTLVLIDGRRTVAGVPGTAQVDVSMIPPSFVERVDVLTGGASAVYGSDAIAGVVNFIYKKHFKGFQANVQEGISGKGDDAETDANMTFGSDFAGGRGNFMGYVGYNQASAVYSAARAFSATQVTSLGSTERKAGASDLNLQAAKDLFLPTNSLSSVGPGGIFVIGANSNQIINPDGTFRAFNSVRDGFNPGLYGQIASPTKRITVAERANFDVTDKLNVFLETTYSNVRTNGEREASPLRTDSALGAFSGTGGFYPIQFAVQNPTSGATVILNNPLVPAAVLAAATNRSANDLINSKDLSFLVRTTAFPPGTRKTPTERDNFRIALGGSLDLGHSWKLDGYYQYSYTKQHQEQQGLANLYNVANALQVVTDVFDVNKNGNTTEAICVDAAARAAGCVPLNIYGLNADGSSKISQAAINYVITNSVRDSKQEMQVGSVNLSGTLFNLPAGPLQVSVGGEYRTESSRDIFDPLTNQAKNGYVQLLNTAGRFDVKEAYGEVVVPVLHNLPLVESLTLRGAYRLSDYSTVGRFSAWNVGGEWAPVPDVRFRAVYAHAVRAPNIGELFAASAAGIVTIVDPCQGVTLTSTGSTSVNCRANPAILANINANGSFSLVTSDLNGVGGVTSANPNIKQETGKTFTAGVVINPRSINALRNLTLTADYFDIKLEGAISRLATTTVLNKCYVQGLADFCQFVTRRSQPSGAYSIGSVEQIVRGLVNSGGAFTRGLDFTLNYRHGLAGGTASISASWTHLLKNGVVPLTGDAYDNTKGELGTPTDKANVSLDWGNKVVGLTINADYLGPQMLDYENFQTTYVLADGSLPDRSLFTIKSTIYTDAQLRFTGVKGFEFYLGAKNLFDVAYPGLYGGVGGFNASSIYDPIGRRFYAGVRVKM